MSMAAEASLEASRTVNRPLQRMRVLLAFAEADRPLDEDGLTRIVMAQRDMGHMRPDSCRKRRSELARQGLVEPAGIGVSPYGRRCTLWTLTDKGLAVLEESGLPTGE